MIVRVHRSSGWAIRGGAEFSETWILDEILLRDASFRVDEMGRLRMLENQARGSGAELHAWVEGEWVTAPGALQAMVDTEAVYALCLTHVAYHPAERGEFFRLDGPRAGEAVYSARWALFTTIDGRAVLLVDE